MSEPAQFNEGDPKHLLDWLIVQHICEWCGENIDDCDLVTGKPQTPQRQWLERKLDHKDKDGRVIYTSSHWKNWLVCRQCHSWNGFTRWIFPVIKNVMPEHESLSSIMQCQPMAMPAAQIFYVDVKYSQDMIDAVKGQWDREQPVGQREHVAVLDDANFRAEPVPEIKYEITPMSKSKLKRYAETSINPDFYSVVKIP